MTHRTAVVDFEITGLSPARGDRATEIAIVLLEGDDRVVGRFQSLMNAGVRVSPFIEAYTGISNAMLAAAPPAAVVMAEAARFVGNTPMAAHNASFDRRFWQAELARCSSSSSSSGSGGQQPFACTLLLSRRLWPDAPSYKLGSLAALHALPAAMGGRAHRAMADAEVAAELLGRIRRDLRQRYALGDDDADHHCRHELLVRLQGSQRRAMPAVVERYLSSQAREVVASG